HSSAHSFVGPGSAREWVFVSRAHSHSKVHSHGDDMKNELKQSRQGLGRCNRRGCFPRLMGLIGAGLIGTTALAQADFPTKPVRLVVGWTPGGLADIAS